MQNSRIVKILKSFSPEEIKEFKKFLKSPFSGCKAYAFKFFEELIKHYPEFEEKNTGRKIIHEKLYKGKKFNDGLIRKMSSELAGFAEEYIMYCEFRNNQAFRDKSLLSGLKNKKLNDLFELRSAKMLDRLEKEKTGSQTFFNKYLIDNEIHSYHLTIKSKQLGEFLESGMVSHIIIFIEHLFHFIRYSNSFGYEYKIKSEILKKLLSNSDFNTFKDSIIRSVTDSEIQDDDKFLNYMKLIFLKYRISENKEDSDSYKKFRDLLFEKKDKLTEHTVINSFAVISQFISSHNSESDTAYLHDAFRINEIILKDKLFLEHSEFLQITFCGYHISTCLRLNRIDAVSDFLKNYSVYFHSEYKKDLIKYCKALILFSEKKYEVSLELVSGTNIDRPALQASVKILKIKNCYELNYMDLVYSELSALKRFYSSEKQLTEAAKSNIKNFINAISKIARLKELKDKNELFILKKKIKHENFIREKSWLMEKLSEIG
ncbi:MAG: hypothetical protein KDD00_16405 [Ignavibacteriae bacterium]|nr:hypothetical protein [Ignavibacteriota bacterium]